MRQTYATLVVERTERELKLSSCQRIELQEPLFDIPDESKLIAPPGNSSVMEVTFWVMDVT